MEASQQKSSANPPDDISLKNTDEPCLHCVGSRNEQRWETLFEPHFTFNKTTKYLDPRIAREKGSERQASMILQQKNQQQRRSSQFQLASSAATLPVVIEERQSRVERSVDIESEPSLDSISVASSPTLPRMQDLMLPIMDQPNQISILPCPSQSLDDLQNARSRPLHKMDEWKERLDLLNSIHQGPGRHRMAVGDRMYNQNERKSDDASRSNGKEEGYPDQEITETNRVVQKESFSLLWWRRSEGLIWKYHPYRTFRTKMDQLKKEAELPFFTTQLILQQEREKRAAALSESPLALTVVKGEENEDIVAMETPSFFQKYRLSFLYFIFGFIFPPVWIVGALYMKRSEDMANADYQWRRRCRNALTFCLLIILLTILLILIINPSALGWRQSSAHL